MRKRSYILLVLLVVIACTSCKNNSDKDNKIVITDDNNQQTENNRQAESNQQAESNTADGLVNQTPINAKELEEFKAEIDENKEMPVFPEVDLTNQYTVKEFIVDEEGLSCASGIVCREDDILITDKDNNCIKVFNYKGELIEEVGQNGNGELEFINPTGITEDNGLIYVVDSGNYRIVILNEDLTYNSSILYSEELTNSQGEYMGFNSIVIQNNNIYLSGDNTVKSEIWCLSEQGEQFPLDLPAFAGTMYYGKECLYALDTMEVWSAGMKTGENKLYIIKDNKVTDTIEMPYMMGARDFLVKDDEIYVITCTFDTVEKLDLKGNYTGRLGIIPYSNTIIFGIDMDNDGAIYVINGTSLVYKIEEKK